MSETEHEQPAEPVEPADDDADDAEADEDETPTPQEADTSAEPEAAPAMSEKELDKVTKALEREASRHAGAVSKLMGDDSTLLEVCARCWELAPGFHFPLNMAPVSDEQRAAVLASLGMGANSEPELPMAEGVAECPKCEGYGELRLPSKSEHYQRMGCPMCQGKGYVNTEPEQPAYTPPPLDPAVFTPQPQYGANGGQTDQWGRPQGHPHYGQNPVTVGV
jgi:hypothetical protein